MVRREGSGEGRGGDEGDPLSQQENRSERFKHLLQPIRDLAQNWDIDIATSLEDYLEDLEMVTISIEGGEQGLNFAEAALVIQGSSAVYSRKVEHLYALVLRTIEQLSSGRFNAAAAAGEGGEDDGEGGGGGGGAGSRGKGVDQETGFLLLDDMLKEGNDIDLAPSATGGGGVRAAESSRAARRRQLGLKPMFADSGKAGGDAGGEAAAGGGGGEPISRQPLFLMEQDHGNAFKMGTCVVHRSGALMLDGGPLLSATALPQGDTEDGIGGSRGGADGWAGVGGERAPAGKGDYDDDDDDDDVGDNGGDAFDFGYGDEGGGGGGGEEEGETMVQVGEDMDQGGQVEDEGTAANGGGYSLRHRGAQHQQQAEEEGQEELEKEEPDPWEALDPHDDGGVPPKPFRQGRTFRLPLSLRKTTATSRSAKVGSKGKKAADGAAVVPNRAEVDWLAREMGETEDGALRLRTGLGSLCYSEFAYIQRANRLRLSRHKRQQRRREEAEAGMKARTGTRYEQQLVIQQQQQQDQGRGGAVDYYCDEGDEDGEDEGGYGMDYGAGGFAGDEDDDEDEGEDGYGYGGYDGGGNEDGAGYAGGGEHGGYDNNSGIGPMSLEHAFLDAPQTYEDLCRSHIEAYMRGAELFAQETKLSLRVSAWQQRLEPLMEQQENRDPFDIHRYGEHIITRIADSLEPDVRDKVDQLRSSEGSGEASKALKGVVSASEVVVPFAQVVAGKERFDICRMFLASLQLANNGNLSLHHGADASQQLLRPFELELASVKGVRNISSSYLAPSVQGAAAAVGDTAVE